MHIQYIHARTSSPTEAALFRRINDLRRLACPIMKIGPNPCDDSTKWGSFEVQSANLICFFVPCGNDVIIMDTGQS